MSNRIDTIHAHEILDSRGNPTVRVSVLLKNGIIGTASVPSGASTGSHEALELRDGGKRYQGKGVLKAVRHIQSSIRKMLEGTTITRQREIDERLIALDGTVNKKKLGANAVLGVSLACAAAAAKAERLPLYGYLRSAFRLPLKTFRLPFPTMNVLNGGAHAHWATDVQEFMIVPQQKRVAERVRCGSEVFHALGNLLLEEGFRVGIGDEGGYAVPLSKNEQALAYMEKAIDAAGYRPGKEVLLAMDVAASEFYDDRKKKYVFPTEGMSWSSEQMKDWLVRLAKKYPLLSVEDGLAEDDWEGWQRLTDVLGSRLTLVGDDLFVTNKGRLEAGIKAGVANAILIKPNQIGTLSETMDTILSAQKNGYKVSVSHRSGETVDTFIVDLAVAVNADFLKAGSLSRAERVEKYNRLMEIEEEVK